MYKKLIGLVLSASLVSCDDYSQVITNSTEILAYKGYTNITFDYTANSDNFRYISALCNYKTTLVFTALDKNKTTNTLAVCTDTKQVHLISKVLN